MNKRDKVASGLLRPVNPSVIIVLGFYTVLWGLWLLSPFWTVFTQAPLYSEMMGLGPEPVWGVIAIISGGFICRGAIKPSYMNLRVGSFVGFMYWLIVGILYLMGDWMNTGGITALTFALYSALIWVNIKVNRAHFEYNMKVNAR